MIRVVLAEDQAMVRGAFAGLLDLEPDIEVVAVAEDGEQGLAAVAEHEPDILLTDIEMPGMTGLELASRLKDHPTVRVVIVTTFARSGYLRRALDAGVSRYVLKDSPIEDLADALRRVAAGNRVIAPELADSAWAGSDPLTDREREVLREVGEGHPNAEIAQRLHLAEGTVRNYLSSAIVKLEARNRTEAFAKAQEGDTCNLGRGAVWLGPAAAVLRSSRKTGTIDLTQRFRGGSDRHVAAGLANRSLQPVRRDFDGRGVRALSPPPKPSQAPSHFATPHQSMKRNLSIDVNDRRPGWDTEVGLVRTCRFPRRDRTPMGEERPGTDIASQFDLTFGASTSSGRSAWKGPERPGSPHSCNRLQPRFGSTHFSRPSLNRVVEGTYDGLWGPISRDERAVCGNQDRGTYRIGFSNMRAFFRYVLLGYAWLFVAAIVVQVYFAGLMLFGQEGGNDLHLGTGYVLSMAGLLFLALPALARAGARTVVLGVVLSVITFFQPTITFAREESPVIAALHPVNGLLIFALSMLMILRATQLVREERASARSTGLHESPTTT